MTRIDVSRFSSVAEGRRETTFFIFPSVAAFSIYIFTLENRTAGETTRTRQHTDVELLI